MDAQVLYGGSRAYANYVFGVYMAAEGSSLQFALAVANLYGAVKSHYPDGTKFDACYGHIPAANVADITAGFNAELTGKLCQPKSK